MWLAIAALLASACASGPSEGPSDAMGDGWVRTCWGGGGTPTPDQVELILGTGVYDFVPLEDGGEVPMRHGLQGGAHFELHVRMRGFQPGRKGDATVPAPHSYFSVYDLEGNRITPLECAYPRAYIDASDEAGPGWYELELGSQLFVYQDVFPTLDGETVLVRLEVQDPAGHYAMVERMGVVHDLNPPVPTDAGVPDGGAPDGGVLDGGP